MSIFNSTAIISRLYQSYSFGFPIALEFTAMNSSIATAFPLIIRLNLLLSSTNVAHFIRNFISQQKYELSRNRTHHVNNSDKLKIKPSPGSLPIDSLDAKKLLSPDFVLDTQVQLTRTSFLTLCLFIAPIVIT